MVHKLHKDEDVREFPNKHGGGDPTEYALPPRCNEDRASLGREKLEVKTILVSGPPEAVPPCLSQRSAANDRHVDSNSESIISEP